MAGRVGACFCKGVCMPMVTGVLARIRGTLLPAPSEGADGCALVRHSDSMLRVVVCSALCQSSQLLVFEVEGLHSLIGGVPRTVEIDGESVVQDRADGQLMKRPKRSPGRADADGSSEGSFVMMVLWKRR
jgi:hypothetical protein